MKKLSMFCGLSLAVVSLSGCVSDLIDQDGVAARFGGKEEVVIARSGNLKETPEWVATDDIGYSCSFAKDGSIQKKKVASGERFYCVRSEAVRPATKDLNRNTLKNKARADGKGVLANTVSTKVKAIFEGADESDIDQSTAAAIISAVAESEFSGLKVAKEYWEKKTSISEDGTGINMNYYVLSYISEKDLRTAIDAVLNKNKKSVSQRTQKLMYDATDSLLSDE